VTFGTRTSSSFFAYTDTLEVLGTITLDITNHGATYRHLAHILQSAESDEFELQVELEAV